METRVIANKYELLKQVGRGGSSIVYLATDLRLNKNWAVKEIRKQMRLEGQHISYTLLAEANLMKNLDHPALPRIVDIIEEQERYYIVMDYVEGETLKHVLEQFGPQRQEQVISWGIELAGVLDYLHHQQPPIIYRDMKPANIILQPDNRLKVIDFGIARTYKENHSDDTTALGTKGYAAPEQFQGKGQTDARTDVYNLGVTLYELLTDLVPSEPPYELQPLREIDPALSAGLEKILLKATRPNPSERIQTANEFAELLRNYKQLDESYIQMQRKRLKKVAVPFFSGIAAILVALCLFFVDANLTSNQYQELLVYTGNPERRIENLKKAIQLQPQKKQAYEELLKEFESDGISEAESQQIFSVYNEAMSNIREKSETFAEINYFLGESYLVYYTGDTDHSLRNKLLTSLPFFEAVLYSEQTEKDYYNLSKSYVRLGNFYQDYVIAEGVFIKEASKEDYIRLLADMQQLLRLVDLRVGNENGQLKIITYSLIINLIDVQRVNFVTCIKETNLQDIVTEIEKSTETLVTANAGIEEEKNTLLGQIESLKEKIRASYENERKQG